MVRVKEISALLKIWGGGKLQTLGRSIEHAGKSQLEMMQAATGAKPVLALKKDRSTKPVYSFNLVIHQRTGSLAENRQQDLIFEQNIAPSLKRNHGFTDLDIQLLREKIVALHDQAADQATQTVTTSLGDVEIVAEKNENEKRTTNLYFFYSWDKRPAEPASPRIVLEKPLKSTAIKKTAAQRTSPEGIIEFTYRQYKPGAYDHVGFNQSTLEQHGFTLNDIETINNRWSDAAQSMMVPAEVEVKTSKGVVRICASAEFPENHWIKQNTDSVTKQWLTRHRYITLVLPS